MSLYDHENLGEVVARYYLPGLLTDVDGETDTCTGEVQLPAPYSKQVSFTNIPLFYHCKAESTIEIVGNGIKGAAGAFGSVVDTEEEVIVMMREDVVMSVVGFVDGKKACCDPLILLHFDAVKVPPVDTDYFYDSSKYNRIVSRVGSSLIDSTNKFPVGSMATLIGTSGRAQWRVDGDLNLGTKFTVDLWVYHVGQGGDFASDLSGWGLWLKYDNWGDYRDNILKLFSEDSTVPGETLGFACHFNDLSGSNYSVSKNEMPTGTWHHLAFVKDGLTHTFYVNGIQVQQWEDLYTSFAAHIYENESLNPLQYLEIIVGSTGPQVYVDEVRVEGIARWNAPFTPPTAPCGG